MADPAHEQTEELLEEIERRVRREYLRAYEETEEKLADYLRRFEAKDRMHAEAVARGEETRAEYAQWRKGQILVGKRWQEMVDTLAEDYRNADRIAASIINGYLPDAYALNHDYATFQVERGSRVDTSYTLYDRATVERLLRDEPDLLPVAKVDGKKDLAWNRRHVVSAVTQGILQGESLPKVAQRLRTVAGMDFRASMRTARTTMTSAQNAGRTDAYRRAQGMGIQVRKQWLSTLDQRTRHSHRRLDGETVGVDEAFSNGLMYPGDPSGSGGEVYNCRCTLVADLEGVDQSDGRRASKLGGVSYEEWRAGHERPRPVEAAPAPEGALFPNVAQALGQDYVDAMDTLLSFTEEQDAAQVYRRYGNSVRIGDSGIEGGAYFDNADGRVYMNAKKVREGDDLHRPYQTAFHEFAHAVDYHSNGGMWSSVQYRDENGDDIRQILGKDWEKYKMDRLRSVAESADEDLFEALMGGSPRYFVRYNTDSDLNYGTPKQKKEAERMRSMKSDELITDPYFIDWVYEMVGNGVAHVDNRAVVSILKKDHQDLGEGAIVSDALEGVTGIDFPLGSGHGRDYHALEGNTIKEFFAEVMDSKITNPASLNLAREVFPNAVKAVESLLKEMQDR